MRPIHVTKAINNFLRATKENRKDLLSFGVEVEFQVDTDYHDNFDEDAYDEACNEALRELIDERVSRNLLDYICERHLSKRLTDIISCLITDVPKDEPAGPSPEDMAAMGGGMGGMGGMGGGMPGMGGMGMPGMM